MDTQAALLVLMVAIAVVVIQWLSPADDSEPFAHDGETGYTWSRGPEHYSSAGGRASRVMPVALQIGPARIWGTIREHRRGENGLNRPK